MSAFSRIIILALVIGITNGQLAAQRTANKLRSSTWFMSRPIQSTDIRFEDKNNRNYNWKARFSSTGKIIITNLKSSRIDSSYSYRVKRKIVTIMYPHRDSTTFASFKMKKRKTNSFKLRVEDYYRFKDERKPYTPAYDELVLSKGGKTKTIRSGDEVSVFYEIKGQKHDSLEIKARGGFMAYRQDTVILLAEDKTVHNFYKKSTDSLHISSTEYLDTILRVKIPVKQIVGIYYHKKPLRTPFIRFAIVAGAVELSSIPPLITDNNTRELFGTVALVSGCACVTATIIGLVFNKVKYRIAPSPKHKSTWRIEKPGNRK